MFRSRLGLIVLAFGLLAAAVACGGDSADDDDATAAAPDATSTASDPATEAESDEVELDFVLSDFAIEGPESVEAGLIRFNVFNEGAVIHELVIVRTDTAADALPVESGLAVEADLDVIGEVEEVPGGESRSATFQLDAGRYLLICNVPGHYQLGMVGELIVT